MVLIVSCQILNTRSCECKTTTNKKHSKQTTTITLLPKQAINREIVVLHARISAMQFACQRQDEANGVLGNCFCRRQRAINNRCVNCGTTNKPEFGEYFGTRATSMPKRVAVCDDRFTAFVTKNRGKKNNSQTLTSM